MADKKVIVGIDLQAAQAIKSAAQLEAQIAKLTTNNRDLRKELAKLQKRENELTATRESQVDAIRVQSARYGENSQEVAALRGELRKTDLELEEVQGKIRNVSTDLNSNKEAVKAARAEQREFNKVAATTPDTLARQRLELSQLKKEYANFRIGVDGTAEDFEDLKRRTLELNESIKRQEEEVGVFTRNVGDYKNSIKDAFSESLTAALGFEEGLGESAKRIGDTLQQVSKGTLILFAAEKILQATTALFDYQQQLEETRKQVTLLTGASGDLLDEQTALASSIAETYGVEAKEVITATNALSKQLGISFEDAGEAINKGFATGANASGDFLDQLREYPAQLRQIGLDADQSIAIITQSVQQGVFSDKGIDAIKEAGIRLRELTPATREALDGIGLSSEAIEQSIRDGSQSVFDVIQQVGGRLQELPDNATEVGAAIADIFGGPGEDAGLNYLRLLGDIETDLDKVVANGGEFVQTQTKLQKANQRIALTFNRIFGTADGLFDSITAEAKTLLADGLEAVVNGIIDVINYFRELYNESVVLRVAFQSTVTAVKNIVDIVAGAFNIIIGNVKTFARVIKAALTGNFDEIPQIWQEGVKEWTATVVDTGKEVANNFIEGYDAVVNNERLEPIKLADGATDDAKQTGMDVGNAYVSGIKEAVKNTEFNTDALEAERANLTRRIEIETEYSAQSLNLKRDLLEIEKQLEIANARETGEDVQIIELLYQAKRTELEAEYLKQERETALKSIERQVLEKSAIETRAFEQRRADLAAQRTLEEIDEETYRTRLEELERQHQENLLIIQRETLQIQLETELLNEQERLTALAELAAIEAEIEEGKADQVTQSEERIREEKKKTQDERKKEADAEAQRVAELRGYRDDIISDVQAVTNEIINAFGEQSAAARAAFAIQRAAAVAQIGIDTQETISAAITTGERINALLPFAAPFVGIAYTVGRTALALAQGAARVANIRQQRFAEGGPVADALTRLGGVASGPSHSEGGIPGVVQGVPVEFEGGEFIVRKEATQRNADVIEQVNSDAGRSRFGLVKLYKDGGPVMPAVKFAAGGLTQPVAAALQQEAISSASLTDAVRTALESMPSPVVSVVEIAETANRVSVKESRATL